MISAAESGLSSQAYVALKSQFTDYVYKVIAKRYNLDFGTSAWVTINSDPVAEGATPNFDAVIWGGYLVHVIPGSAGLRRIDLSTGSIQNPLIIAPPSGLTPMGGYSLVLEDNVLHVFAATSTGVSKGQLTNYGDTWSGWTAIYTVSAQTFYSGDVCRKGTGTASSVLVSGELSYPGSNAFDGVEGNQWQTANGVTAATLEYDFEIAGGGRTVVKYSINAPGSAAPKDWTFQAWTGSTWTTLDTQTNITGWAAGGETKTYTFSNTNSYSKYRLNISANNGFTQTFVTELDMFEVVNEEQSVMMVSATASTRCHLVYGNAANRTFNLRVLNYSGSWTATSSPIVLTDRPLSMDAVTNGDHDFVVVNSEVPGQITTYLDETTLKFKRLKAKAVMNFIYKVSNPSWSPHYLIDSVAELTAYTDVKNVKVEYTNETLYVTAYRSSGTEENPITGYRVYTSKDGAHWSSPRHFALGALKGSGGAKWLTNGDYVFAVERHMIWRSLSTDFAGGTPASLTQDITSYVNRMSLNKGDMAQVTLELDNGDGWLDNHSFINQNSVVKLDIYLGGTDSAGVDQLYLDTSAYIDTFSLDQVVSGESIRFLVQVSGRDATSWMTDDTVAEDAYVFEGFQSGHDTFLSEIDSDFGGLAHWWPVFGEWKTEGVFVPELDNIGKLLAPVKQTAYNYAIGRSTFMDFVWNGTIQVALSMPGCDAFAGVCFRGKSVNNLFFHWFWAYDRVTDKLYLQYRVGFPADPDRAFTVYTSSAKSWTSAIQSGYKWLRAEFFYGTMYLYSSGDGITWTLETTQTVDCLLKQLPGLSNYDDTVQLFDRVEAGYVGLEADAVAESAGPGAGDRVEFQHLSVTDYGNPLNIEEAYKTFASFANIHDWSFDDSYAGASSGWTLGSGVTLEATGGGSSFYGEAVYGVSTYG